MCCSFVYRCRQSWFGHQVWPHLRRLWGVMFSATDQQTFLMGQSSHSPQKQHLSVILWRSVFHSKAVSKYLGLTFRSVFQTAGFTFLHIWTCDQNIHLKRQGLQWNVFLLALNMSDSIYKFAFPRSSVGYYVHANPCSPTFCRSQFIFF